MFTRKNLCKANGCFILVNMGMEQNWIFRLRILKFRSRLQMPRIFGQSVGYIVLFFLDETWIFKMYLITWTNFAFLLSSICFSNASKYVLASECQLQSTLIKKDNSWKKMTKITKKCSKSIVIYNIVRTLPNFWLIFWDELLKKGIKNWF